jgi:glyoxylase-like metal-dependent hydrolase (beta-lactamase superfamily II)
VPVEVTLLNAGTCRVPARAASPGAGWGRTDLPALVALIRHPTAGPVLYDTGYSPRFFTATKWPPYRMYRYLTPVSVTDAETAVAQLQALGIAPGDVKTIVISHFDPDHIGGMRDFPEARFVCAWEAWDSIRDKSGLAALGARLLPGHLPDDLGKRLQVLGRPTGPAAGPFPASHDLFGDGSVRLVELPGHAPGQLGALVQVDAERQWLLAADACWTRAVLSHEGFTAHEVIAEDRPTQRATYELLRHVHRAHPEITIVPAHCPEAADELLDSPWRSSR